MYQEVSENFVSDALERGYIQSKGRAMHHQRNTVFIMLKMMLEW
ncbi:Protein of unknown function [Lactobacillus delbrueckii subsp. bulgaricus]|nr:Protein of unknown function [Lactobacillus delbrueckii subsp. bulgaricus]